VSAVVDDRSGSAPADGRRVPTLPATARAEHPEPGCLPPPPGDHVQLPSASSVDPTRARQPLSSSASRCPIAPSTGHRLGALLACLLGRAAPFISLVVLSTEKQIPSRWRTATYLVSTSNRVIPSCSRHISPPPPHLLHHAFVSWPSRTALLSPGPTREYDPQLRSHRIIECTSPAQRRCSCRCGPCRRAS
jgi:hypothetical protein